MKHVFRFLVLLAGFFFFLPFANTQTPAICYEIFIRSFADSNGDGIGDINGITAKLDYLESLQVDAIWITPVSPSPSYHKYDVTNYKEIDPEYGTMADFKNLITETRNRNIKVIFDLVVNHTSSQHPWFQEAMKGKDNPYRDYYVWMPPKAIDSMGVATREAGGGSWELTPWHWANKEDSEKYYGLFWGGMPDLNFDNPKVRKEIFEAARFWLEEVGVDGFRLDAAKHVYPEWEAEKCQAFWQEFSDVVHAIKPDVYLVGEIWTTAALTAPYFKPLQGNFNIDLHKKLQYVLKNEKQGLLVDSLLLAHAQYRKYNPRFIDATLLSNHDQNRIATEVNNHPAKLRQAAALLFTLPGQPYLYYGEEIGMLGEKPDELIREPFLWDEKSKDTHRTTWEKPGHSLDGAITPLAQQMKDPASLYNHYKSLAALRKSHPALAQVVPANLQASTLQHESVVAFIRPHQQGNVLVLHNVSGKTLELTLPKQEKAYKRMLYTWGGANRKGRKVVLPGYTTLVLKQ